MTNLDFLCMQTAQAMAAVEGERSDKENLATKALGVLLENGPYGTVLYLETQKRKGGAPGKYTELLVKLCGQEVLKECFPKAPSTYDFPSVTNWLREEAADLDSYLFIKRLWQQALTYTRYHCKASPEPASPEPPSAEES